jgi:aryl-alcohol dehydrogenase-like predicted oxidoreductase
MEFRKLGPDGPDVSLIGLGTMTWGEQNTAQEAFAQLDAAVAAGVNLIDVAEMYPVPPRAETQGRTEAIVGEWIQRRGHHDDVLIATKVAGGADWLPWIRGGPKLDGASVKQACEDSLRRLQVDCIDLYQVHWPDRKTNFFGQLGYTQTDVDHGTPIAETLHALAELQQAGKIKHIGISNETPWGLSTYLALAEKNAWPRVVSVQNPYNLLNRSYEVGLAEFAPREGVGLLAYSPLAFGVLSGKYLQGARPAGARLSLFQRFARYTNPEAEAATQAYVALATEHGLSPAQMALAFVNAQPFVSSNLIGATSMTQLEENLGVIEQRLSPELRGAIEAIHKRHPNPAP